MLYYLLSLSVICTIVSGLLIVVMKSLTPLKVKVNISPVRSSTSYKYNTDIYIYSIQYTVDL